MDNIDDKSPLLRSQWLLHLFRGSSHSAGPRSLTLTSKSVLAPWLRKDTVTQEEHKEAGGRSWTQSRDIKEVGGPATALEHVRIADA
jgi:hypothetical protein